MTTIKTRGQLIVGVSADNLLFGYRNPISGQLEGFDIDIANEVAKALFGSADGHVKYKVLNFAQRIPDLQHGNVDMVADIVTINCSRWSQIAFSTEYFRAAQQILVHKGMPYGSIQDLNGKKVCAAQGSTSSETLKSYPTVVSEITENVSDCLVLFQQAAVEGIISDGTVLAGFAKQDPYAQVVGPPITTEPYGLGFPQQNVDFVKFVNAVLERLRADGWAGIYEKWLSGPAPSPPLPVYGRAQP